MNSVFSECSAPLSLGTFTPLLGPACFQLLTWLTNTEQVRVKGGSGEVGNHRYIQICQQFSGIFLSPAVWDSWGQEVAPMLLKPHCTQYRVVCWALVPCIIVPYHCSDILHIPTPHSAAAFLYSVILYSRLKANYNSQSKLPWNLISSLRLLTLVWDIVSMLLFKTLLLLHLKLRLTSMFTFTWE